MTGIRMVSLGLRLVALWFVVLAIQAIGVTFAVQKMTAIDRPGSPWWASLPVGIFLFFAVVTWFFSATIAKRLYPGEQAGETVQLTEETMLRVGSCLLGLWTFASVLPAMGRLVVEAYLGTHIGLEIPPESQLHAVYVLVQLVVAIALVFGNRTIYRLTLGR